MVLEVAFGAHAADAREDLEELWLACGGDVGVETQLLVGIGEVLELRHC